MRSEAAANQVAQPGVRTALDPMSELGIVILLVALSWFLMAT